MGPVFEEVPHLQQLAPSRSLVTYREAPGGAASNSQDAGPATPAPAGYSRAAEVIVVARLAQPLLLTGLFAGRLALRGGTIHLASLIPVIGNKYLLTLQTLAANGVRLHRVENPPR